jgi:hypothetical protein
MTTVLDTPVDALAPIALEELNERAALQTRVDRKYLLRPDAVTALLDAVAPVARVLEIGGRRRFGYRSVYLDTALWDSYHAAATGRRRRFKVRLRSYLDHDGPQWIEVKLRGPRATTVKHRRAVTDVPRAFADGSVDGAWRLDEDSAGFVAGVLAAARVDLDVSALRPVLTTSYRRTTLLVEPGCRVTIDTHPSWSLVGAGRGFALPGIAIVETKSAGSASTVDMLLWSRGHRPARISKYCTGLAALVPELRANRWQPVLRGYFSEGSTS